MTDSVLNLIIRSGNSSFAGYRWMKKALVTLFYRTSPFTGIWDMTLLILALALGLSVSLLLESGRLASTQFAVWVWRGSLSVEEAKTVFNSLGIAITGFSAVGLVIFLMAYPPRPWRISPFRLRVLVIASLLALAVGTALWFDGDSLATLTALQSRFPGSPNWEELRVYFSSLSILLGVASIVVLGVIWASRQGHRAGYARRGLALPNLSPSAIAKSLAIYIAVAFVILAGFHWFNGSPITSTPRMAISDFRVAAKCPNKPGTVLRFVQRSQLESWGVGLAQLIGEDWVSEICNGVLDDA